MTTTWTTTWTTTYRKRPSGSKGIHYGHWTQVERILASAQTHAIAGKKESRVSVYTDGPVSLRTHGNQWKPRESKCRRPSPTCTSAYANGGKQKTEAFSWTSNTTVYLMPFTPYVVTLSTVRTLFEYVEAATA